MIEPLGHRHTEQPLQPRTPHRKPETAPPTPGGGGDFDDLFEHAPIAIHWVGPDGIVMRVNRRELEMLGYGREEYVGQPIARFHVDQEAISDLLKRLAAGETVTNHEAQLRCKDGSIRHVMISSSVVWEKGRFVHTCCFTTDTTEHKKAEETNRLLLNEIKHRAKNTLATVQAIAMQTLRADDERTAFCARLRALADAHDLLTHEHWDRAPLRDVLSRALKPFLESYQGRIVVDGPDAWAGSGISLSLTMAIHELATNAAKYGALSNATGRMHLTWQPSETPGRMKLVWRETGGPPVTKPESQGFGLRLVGGALESELRTQLDFNRDGVVCTFDVAL